MIHPGTYIRDKKKKKKKNNHPPRIKEGRRTLGRQIKDVGGSGVSVGKVESSDSCW